MSTLPPPFLILKLPKNYPEFLPTYVTGNEGISTCYAVTITAWSTLLPKQANTLLNCPVALGIQCHDTEERHWLHGLVDTINVDYIPWRNHYQYQFTLVPELSNLALSQDSRTYLDCSVHDILRDVFERHQLITYEDFDLCAHYPEHPFWVQYNETTLNFVTRLLAEWNIYYTFDMNADQHTLHLGDTVPRNTCPLSLHHHGKLSDTLTHWHTQRHAHTATDILVRDAHLGKLISNHSGPPTPAATTQVHYAPSRHLTYAYDANQYMERDTANNTPCHTTYTASTHHPGLRPGQHSSVSTPEGNHDLLITHITHHAECPQPQLYCPNSPQHAHYTATVQGMPMPRRYYPPPPKPRRLEKGVHYAWVTAASDGNTTDHFGHVTVHFTWDRHRPRDQPSTDWVRVRYPGPMPYTLALPRPGDEVAILFDNGRLDYPVVVGALYNADNRPPYALPNQAHHSFIGTNLTHETTAQGIAFNDTPNQEHVTLHAAHNYRAEIGDTYTATVGGDYTITIGGNVTRTLDEGDYTQHHAGNDTTHIPHGTFELNTQHGVTFATPGASISLKPEGIHLQAQRIHILSQGGGERCFAAAQGDTQALASETGAAMGTIQEGATQVRINGQPVAREGDACSFNTCISSGVSGIYIDGDRIAHVGASVSGPGINGTIIDTQANVLVGGYQPQPDPHTETQAQLQNIAGHVAEDDEPQVIPIIFVPGIMGSRLKYDDGEPISDENKVWDPDDTDFTSDNYLSITPEERKALMLQNSIEGLAVMRDDVAHHIKHFATYFQLDTPPPETAKEAAYRTEIDKLTYFIQKTTGQDPDSRQIRKWTYQRTLLETQHTDLKTQRLLDTEESIRRGWGGVYWASYGSVLKALTDDSTLGFPALDLLVNCPVHAFGYNWLQSNRDSGKELAEYIDAIITHYTHQARVCERVLLVTHSMGGLVARATCKFHPNITQRVLGIIHAGQPTCGAPVAYSRMKQGFERPDITPNLYQYVYDYATMHILGNSGKHVTAILAESPAGLELLPNKHYRTNTGEPGWLHVTRPQPSGETYFLPQNDPYQEIYREKEKIYRLIEPDWLLPPHNDQEKLPDIATEENTTPAWVNYEKQLKKAETFHDDLGTHVDVPTVELYTTDYPTPDRMAYHPVTNLSKEDIPKQINQSDEAARSGYDMTAFVKLYHAPLMKQFPKKSEGRFISPALNNYAEIPDGYTISDALTSQAVWQYELTLPSNEMNGDGTVPVSSAQHLSTVAANQITAHAFGQYDISKKTEREHQNLFNSPTIQHKLKHHLAQWTVDYLNETKPQTPTYAEAVDGII